MLLGCWFPSTTDPIAHGLTRTTQFALVTYCRNEDFVVEVHTHSLDDLMIEEAIARMPRSCSSCLRYSANTSKRRMRFAGLIVTRAKVHFAGAFAGRVQA